MSFFSELRRRNVFKVGVAYSVACWLGLQIIDLVLDNIDAPDWVMQVFLLGAAVGLPVALIVAWAFEVTPDGVKLQKYVDQSKSISKRTGNQLNRGIIVILSVAIVLLLTERFRDELFGGAEPAKVQADSTEITADDPKPDELEKSIAVLPFVNMSSDPEQEYFADGISEEILNALAGVSELKVAGRTSSFAFKGKNEDLLEIGKVLRVNHILEGSVRKSGKRVRITAQLIKVDDGFHMWSETYDRELNDIFTIQDEISAAILSQLKAQLLGEQQIEATIQTDTRAYELYLLAKQRIYERNQASLEMAIKLVEEAIKIDSTYAPAYAQLGIATILVSERAYGTLPHTQAGEQAKSALDKALQLDPRNAEALAGLGFYFRAFELDHQMALELLQKASSINPNLTNANTWFAQELGRAGNLRKALEIREQTFERDPLHSANINNLQQTYVIMGQSDKALKLLDKVKDYQANSALLLSDYGQVKYMTGHLAEAQSYFMQSQELEPLSEIGRLWFGFTLLASRQYEQMAEFAPDFIATWALSRLGRTEEALILGKQTTAAGRSPAFYFMALLESGRFDELIQELESRWPSLEDFDKTFPQRGYGNGSMASIAQAYRELGNLEKFNKALVLLKGSLDAQQAEGADNWLLDFSYARYAMLVDDHDAAISYLEKGFQKGGYLDTVNESAFPIFKPLNGNPRYETAKAAMNARLEKELEKMNSNSFPTGVN